MYKVNLELYLKYYKLYCELHFVFVNMNINYYI